MRRYWVLLLVGLLVAAGAGLLSGFSIGSDGLKARATSTYSATTTLQLSDPNLSPFASEVAPPTAANGQTTVDQTQRQNLSTLALLYAYYAVSDEVRGRTESAVGTFGPDERVTAASRTTQPGGTEAFPGRFSLPLLDVVGFATSPGRAEQLSQTGAANLISYVQEMQQAQGVPAGSRIAVTQVRTTSSVVQSAGSVLLPVVLVAVAVLLLFVALAFVLQNISDHREPTGGGRRRRENGASDTDPAPPRPGPGPSGPGDSGVDDLLRPPQPSARAGSGPWASPADPRG